MVKTWSTPVIIEKKGAVPCILCGYQDFEPALDCEGFSFVRCTHCSLVQQNPQPDINATQARYADRSSQDYLSYELANEDTFLELQQKALKDGGFFINEQNIFNQYVSRGNPPRVLDIGCATGSLLAWLRDRGWDPLGVELCSPEADYGRRVRNLPIITGTIETAKLESSSVDVALASHVIEHVNNPRSFVTEAYRIIKTGGYFYITTPTIDGFQAKIFGSHWRSAIFDHLYLFSKKTLRTLLEEAGFTIEATVTWGGLAKGTVPQPVKIVADALAKRIQWGDVVLMRCLKASAR